MNERDLQQILDTLRDLTAFVSDAMQRKERTLNSKRPFLSENLERRRTQMHADLDVMLERAGTRTSPNAPADAGNKVDSQLNTVAKKNGVFNEQEEIKIMLLKIPGACVSNKIRSDGRYQGYVVIKGKRHYVYGHSKIEVAKKIKFAFQYGIKQVKPKNVINGIPQNFDDFTKYYFEKFRKKKVSERTLYGDVSRYNNHLFPTFKNRPIKQITPSAIQDLLDNLENAGKRKTASEIYSLLSIILKGAISHGVINKNPLDIVYLATHEREHGVALSDDEIKTLLNAVQGETYATSIAILLYTGLRPNELATVQVDGDFIVARNSKRKNKKVEYKKIPITPMLAPYLKDTMHLTPPDYLRRVLKQILPNHQLYDLRHTFYSKCIECHVDEVARKLFVGHSLGALGNTYTHLSDTFLLEEGKKIRF